MPAVNGGPSRTVARVFPARGAPASYHREMHALIRNMWRASLMQVFLLRVQVYETLQIMLQVGRTHARNGDTVAVAELKHRVTMHVGSNRGRQFLHIMNVGELIELYRVVLAVWPNQFHACHRPHD